ncbi:MAG TPA: TetR family transcriptional regulator [Acidimicrobiales bacterium]
MATDRSATRTRHGQDRKADLLRHAQLLFMERGYDDTRMVDIAAAAGVAKGLVYWYFENKEALFQEIVVDLGRRLRREQGEAVAGIDDPLEGLYLGTVASVRFIAEHHRLYGILHDLVRDDRQLRSTRTESRRVIGGDAVALLAEGQARGLVRDDDSPVVLAHANGGVVYHFVRLATDPGRGEHRLALEDAAHGAARYVVRAVAADPAAAVAIIARHSPS